MGDVPMSCFYEKLIGDILQIDIDPEKVHIGNQEFEKDNGITDLEITDGEQFYIIIEAKRGWILPPENQLIMYSKRKGITQSGVAHKAIVSMSECSTEYANAGKGLELGIRCFSWNRTPG